MDTISQIAPVTDAEAAQRVSAGTLADLSERITAVAAEPRPYRQKSQRRRLLVIAAPLLAGAAAAALVITFAAGGHQATGNFTKAAQGKTKQTLQIEPLAFIAGDHTITVIVRNPLADPRTYRAEFARHHLDITLELIPVSPSLVGTLVESSVSQGADLVPITAEGRCYTQGGGGACPVGVQIPADFHGQADLVFGRAARPGEQYESTTSAFAPGEAMYGMAITGKTVSQVLAELRTRHVSVPVFHYDDKNYTELLRPDQVPGSWYVYDAIPWAPGQVTLFVGPTVKQPPLQQPVRRK